jgi:glucosyl-3-phosphoglycerate synthase
VRRTYSAADFDLDDLACRKAAQGIRTSVVLPSQNEAETVGGVIESVAALRGQLVDEIVVVDAGSTDGTRSVAAASGATVHDERDIFPHLGPGLGKGDGMWRSLAVTSGDLVVFMDTDIRNPGPHYVSSVLGPLLVDPALQLVKGFYRRPIESGGVLQPAGGGRVTELCARPLLNLFWPPLGQLVQPLSGEFAARRELLESIPFCTGYGVEIAMLVDTYTTRGIDAIAQVDLEERIHRNQPLDALARMAFQVAQAAARRSGASPATGGVPARFTQFERDGNGRIEAIERSIEQVERPPLRELRNRASERRKG